MSNDIVKDIEELLDHPQQINKIFSEILDKLNKTKTRIEDLYFLNESELTNAQKRLQDIENDYLLSKINDNSTQTTDKILLTSLTKCEWSQNKAQEKKYYDSDDIFSRKNEFSKQIYELNNRISDLTHNRTVLQDFSQEMSLIDSKYNNLLEVVKHCNAYFTAIMNDITELLY